MIDWEDIPTLEELDAARRASLCLDWRRAFSVWLTGAIKKNTEPAMFKAHYNVLVSSIVLLIEGDAVNIQKESKRFKKLCKNLHQAYKPNSAAIIDSYARAAAKYDRGGIACGKLTFLLGHPALEFCMPGHVIDSLVYVNAEVPSLSVDHPDAQHWYVNANFIEVADMLLQHSGTGHMTNGQ